MADAERIAATRDRSSSVYGALLRALLVAGSVFVLAWIASTISLVLLFAFAAVIIAIALNGPVTWLERRRVPRVAGTLGILLCIGLTMTGVALLVGSKVVQQGADLADNAPQLLDGLEVRSDRLFGSNSELDRAFEPNRSAASIHALLPRVGDIVTRVGQLSLGLAALVVLSITWITVVAYLVIEPRSMLRALLRIAPAGERDAFERTYVVFARMVLGWLWANVLAGLVEGALVAAFLSLINLPGAFVWAVLASVSVFIPKVGAWIMALPPFLVALATDPGMALWIVVFYVVMNEIMSDVVLPRVQGHGMKVHTAYLVVFVLAFASSFGLLGAVVATPFAGLVAAIWDEFVLSRRPPVDRIDERVEELLGATGLPTDQPTRDYIRDFRADSAGSPQDDQDG